MYIAFLCFSGTLIQRTQQYFNTDSKKIDLWIFNLIKMNISIIMHALFYLTDLQTHLIKLYFKFWTESLLRESCTSLIV